MHPEVFEFVRSTLAQFGQPASVIEVGSRDLNGSIRPLFTAADYVGVDIYVGPSVDVVGDFVTLGGLPVSHCVVSAEALEHYPVPREVVHRAYELLHPGGLLIITCASPLRAPHSGIAAEANPRAGEHYRGVSAADLRLWLRGARFSQAHVEEARGGVDVYAYAVK